MSRSGGLLELVARGKKDVFFNANPTVSFFHSVYVRAAPFTKEIHITKPRNVPDWGHWVDFELDQRGDLVKQFYLRITLPTWYDPVIDAINKTGLVSDTSGVTYGYTNNIGFHLLEKIQVFQDQVLLHETYGEYLDWRLRQGHGMDMSYIVADQIGSRDESTLAIGRSASLGELRVPLPLLGWQNYDDPGLPVTALKSERFRIRIFLRRLEDVIVASDGRLRPKPWDMPLVAQAAKNGPLLTGRSYTRDTMKIDVSLETTCVYVQPDVQIYLKAQTLRLPFLHVQHYKYVIEDNLMTAAALSGTPHTYNMSLDFIGSTDRLLLGFRSVASSLAGQLTELRPPNGNQFITDLRLNIANVDRIKKQPVYTFRECAAYWKHRRMALDLGNPSKPQEVYTLTFGGFDKRIPCGTFNLSRATLPIIYVTLAAIPYDERNISRETYALLYCESWNIYEIRNSRGRLFES
jgi:hypothetical protein